MSYRRETRPRRPKQKSHVKKIDCFTDQCKNFTGREKRAENPKFYGKLTLPIEICCRPCSTSVLSIKATKLPLAYRTAGLSFSLEVSAAFAPFGTFCDFGALLLLRAGGAVTLGWLFEVAALCLEADAAAAASVFVWDRLRVSLGGETS